MWSRPLRKNGTVGRWWYAGVCVESVHWRLTAGGYRKGEGRGRINEQESTELWFNEEMLKEEGVAGGVKVSDMMWRIGDDGTETDCLSKEIVTGGHEMRKVSVFHGCFSIQQPLQYTKTGEM